MKKQMFLGLTLLAVSAVVAQPPDGGRLGRPGLGMRPSMLRTALDADHDGIISAAEIKNAAAALKTLDKNGDGIITPDEIRPEGPPRDGGGGPGGARREQGPPPQDDMVATLMRFDKNGDGKLTRDEVPERMQGLFERGDQNKDGVLTAEEIRQMANTQTQTRNQEEPRRGGVGGGPRSAFNQIGFMMREPIYMALDTNHDGKIDADEIAAAPKVLLTLDKNHDGQLTPDELMPSGPPQGGGPGFSGPPDEMADRMFEQFDANHDGKLTRAEVPERMQELFDSADTKKTGFITRDQLVKAFEARRQEQRPERQ